MVLILNSGSSSIKYKLFHTNTNKIIFSSIIENVQEFHQAFKDIFDRLIQMKYIDKISDIQAFGHRVVHGGEKFNKPVIINQNVIDEIKNLIPLAPLHNPANLDGILTVFKLVPDAIQVAVFDTAFHQSIPKEAYIYPISYKFYEKYGIRKYGFHGTSHHYIAKQTAKHLNKPLNSLNLITIHLGNGDSITAIKNGISIDTSMGFTPLEGLMMGTRCGDIDPEIVLYLENTIGIDPKEVDNILNKQSGLKGICDKNDLRDIIKDAKNKDEKAILAIDMFCYRIKKYIGSYKEILGDIDAIVFTGGIGENSPLIREKTITNIDKIKNNNIKNSGEIQNDKSPYKILVIPTDEELEIAIQTKKLL
ncbi:MAG: acetate kinase [Campylobacterota bacterium]|nr:acetate kinase [Campylobacterota bacterium]